MISLSNYPYTKQKILDVLHGKYGARHFKFRYDLLDKNETKIGELDSVVEGEVSMSALAQIKRTANFSIKDTGDINWLSDRIQPFVMLKVGSSYIEFPLGIFLPSSPTRRDENNSIYRDVEAYDGSVILRDDKFESRYFIAAGTNYRIAVIDILLSAGITKHNIEQTDKVLPKSIEFEPGTEKLKIVNELLTAINFTPIYVDVYGYFTSRFYISPSVRSSEYMYKDDELSIIVPGMEEELDLFNVANKWVAVLSDPELEPLTSVYTNESESSPTSTVNRGRTIVDYREVDNIADQQSLDSYVHRIAFESSQIYGKLVFETAINPMHDYYDVLNIEYLKLGINGKYSETSWTLPLQVGATMKHECRKVVSI